MGPKMKNRIDDLERDYSVTKARGELAAALRIRVTINNLRALCEDLPSESNTEGSKP